MKAALDPGNEGTVTLALTWQGRRPWSNWRKFWAKTLGCRRAQVGLSLAPAGTGRARGWGLVS